MSDGKRRKSGLKKRTKENKVLPGAMPPSSPPRASVETEACSASAEPPRHASADGSMAPEESKARGIPVVGLGGSAGALDCFKAILEAMPPDSGAAFVVIQHLAPAHVSMLSELLAQHTRMKVAEARDGMLVEPNCVYVIPPNAYLGIRTGVLPQTGQTCGGDASQTQGRAPQRGHGSSSIGSPSHSWSLKCSYAFTKS